VQQPIKLSQFFTRAYVSDVLLFDFKSTETVSQLSSGEKESARSLARAMEDVPTWFAVI